MYINQQNAWQLLQQAIAQDRLSHAYLLSGIAGAGKTEFAKQFSVYLLCEQKTKTETACGHCRSCLLMQSNSHPDFMLIKPEEKSRTIKIDQVREMSQQLSKTAHCGGYQVVVIAPADAMPVQAANALLKTLEEPLGKIIIFLVDDQRSVLPATIVSRCQRLVFSADAVDLRKYHDALSLRDELFHHVEKITHQQINSVIINSAWLKIPLENILQLLLLLCVDIARLQFSVKKNALINADLTEKLATIAPLISPRQLQKFIEKLLEKKLLISRGINLNAQLCLEDIFIEWETVCS